ncbi:MAG: DUF4864 domain-containing protein [Pseudomonadota bacterium]
MALVRLSLLGLLFVAAIARAEGISTDTAVEIRQIISEQLAAFRADDANRAFSFASPEIQHRFGNPERFLAMVKRGYAPVYRPRRVSFESIDMVQGRPVQRVLVWDQSDQAYIALYSLSHTEALGWRITGCVLKPAKGQTL